MLRLSTKAWDLQHAEQHDVNNAPFIDFNGLAPSDHGTATMYSSHGLSANGFRAC
jgi:hypothetical protein